ncbi:MULTISPECIES: hypothetical protein [unclassified Sphingomonas]|jgi:DNA repair exonuclease SbcCD ATPase subunit|nr:MULTISPECIES: hypothetical protein [unclassified Sphingomonas]
MPTVEDLDRLKKAMATLAGLEAARGELIRAEDWNLLVDIVVDFGRALLAREDAKVVPPHEHRDQVTAEWLAPALRAQIERGPLADPAQSLRLSAAELRLTRLSERLDTQQSAATDLLARFDTITTRDIERQAAVTRLTRNVEAVSDPGPQLDAMRNSLKSVQDNIAKVIDASARLNDAGGRPIDLAALDARVSNLDKFTQRLRGANGEFLDFASLENKLADISAKSVAQDQLTEAIRNAANTRPPNLDQLEASISADLQTRFEGSLNNLKTELDSSVNSRLSGLDGLVDARVTAALPGVTTSINSALDARLSQTRDAAVAAAADSANRDLATRADALRAEFTAGLASSTESVRGLIQNEVTSRVAANLQATAGDLAKANARLDKFADQIATLDASRTDVAMSVAALPQQLAALRAELRDTLIGEATTRANATLAQVTAKFDTLAQQQQQMLSSMTQQIRQSAIDSARSAATEAAQNEVKAARVSILGEVRGITREEIGVASSGVNRTHAPVLTGIGAGNLNVGRIDPVVLRPGGG